MAANATLFRGLRLPDAFCLEQEVVGCSPYMYNIILKVGSFFVLR